MDRMGFPARRGKWRALVFGFAVPVAAAVITIAGHDQSHAKGASSYLAPEMITRVISGRTLKGTYDNGTYEETYHEGGSITGDDQRWGPYRGKWSVDAGRACFNVYYGPADEANGCFKVKTEGKDVLFFKLDGTFSDRATVIK